MCCARAQIRLPNPSKQRSPPGSPAAHGSSGLTPVFVRHMTSKLHCMTSHSRKQCPCGLTPVFVRSHNTRFYTPVRCSMEHRHPQYEGAARPSAVLEKWNVMLCLKRDSLGGQSKKHMRVWCVCVSLSLALARAGADAYLEGARRRGGQLHRARDVAAQSNDRSRDAAAAAAALACVVVR